jgi:ribose transport system ATP-binding protein
MNIQSAVDQDNALVAMTGISKLFGGSRALDDVSLSLLPGSVHALMGENGAGKSTLMKILAGVHRPDRGTVTLRGKPVQIVNPKHALDLGISTVFQELNLLPNLSIAENMFLGREPLARAGLIDRARMRRDTSAALAELGLDLDPDTLVSQLSIGERQFVEIAHGIKTDADVFILDEPTAALNAADVDKLNAQIRRLAAAGKAVVYISHRMDEIFTVCDTVTVLKDGRHVTTQPLAGMTPSELIALMVGRELQGMFPDRAKAQGEVVLSLRGAQLSPMAAPINLDLHRGEILALAGLEGQGQQSLVRAIVGAAQPVSGTLTVQRQEFRLPLRPAALRQMQRLGVGFVPEDRKEEGLFLGHSVGLNIAIGLNAQRPAVSLIKSYAATIRDTIAALRVKTASARSTVGSLSGGNQQKVLLGRSMATSAQILLIEEPTRGVDVGAKAEIYALLRDFTARGGAILVLSRETIELIGLADRILVMHGQTIVAEMPAADATEHRILDAALTR